MIATVEALTRDCTMEELDGQSIFITTDDWTSPKANENHTALTCHFIVESFLMRSFDLGLFLHERGTKGKEPQKDFEKLMLES